MAPSATNEVEQAVQILSTKDINENTFKPFQTLPANVRNGVNASTQSTRLPLKPNGSLSEVERIDLTPVIGTEFPTANLVEWLQSPNADELLTDLAYTSKFAYGNHSAIEK
jgi:hypothetical protein